MFVKKNLSTFLIAFSVSISALANAADLTIINNTNHDSTSVINNGACSDILGPSGITHAHSINKVPEKTLAKGCIFDKSNCKADVHMTNNCSGPTVATVVFDIKTGIKKTTPSTTPQGYEVSGNGFTASIDGGPELKNWFQRIFG